MDVTDNIKKAKHYTKIKLERVLDLNNKSKNDSL